MFLRLVGDIDMIRSSSKKGRCEKFAMSHTSEWIASHSRSSPIDAAAAGFRPPPLILTYGESHSDNPFGFEDDSTVLEK